MDLMKNLEIFKILFILFLQGPKLLKKKTSFRNGMCNKQDFKNVVTDFAVNLNESIEDSTKIKEENENLKARLEKKNSLKSKLKNTRKEIDSLKKKTKYLNAAVQLKNKVLKRTRSQIAFMKLQVEKTNKNFKELETRNNELNNEIGRLQVNIQ